MTTTDTNLQNLIINDISQSDYESITPNANELYLTDEVIESSDIITALGYTPYNSTNPDGFLKNTATGTNSLTLLGGVSGGTQSVNIGYSSYAANSATALGYYTSASNYYSCAIGSNAAARGINATAIGWAAQATANGAIQIGQGTNSTANSLSAGFDGSITHNYQLLDGTTGKIPNARLNTLVGAATDNTKFLKGDGTWADLTIPTVDQTYDATSTNAQSGVAIAGAGFVESSDLEEVQCVVETYQNGTSWYRVYSDGWCEQGGVSPSGADQATVTITLLKAFSNTSYTVASVQRDGPSGNYTNGLRIVNYLTNSFQINFRTGGTTTAYWVAYGYIEV